MPEESPDFMMIVDGKRVDAPLHAEMLSSILGERLADEAAVAQAIKIGFSREEAEEMCGSKVSKYSEDQARDERGRWTSGGGGSGSGIEEKLSASGVVKERPLGGGVNHTKVLTLEDGTKAVFKVENREWGQLRPDITPGKDAEREVAAWEVAKLVGMDDMVSPAVIREYKGERGSMLEFVPGELGANKHPSERYDGVEDHARAALFDYVIGNEDRHSGNWLVDGQRLRLIDHGLAFPETRDPREGDQWLVDKIPNRVRATPDGHVPDFKAYAARYEGARKEIVSSLERLGLPKAAVEGVDHRIRALKRAKNWIELAVLP